MTNTDMPITDEWFAFISRYQLLTYDGVRYALLYITPSQQTYTVDSVPALRPVIRSLRRFADIIVVLYQDRGLAGEAALSQLATASGSDLPDVLLDVGSKTAPTTMTHRSVASLIPSGAKG